MKHTIVVCSHNRPIFASTAGALSELTRQGAAFVDQSGSSDVTLARCVALTAVCRSIRHLLEDPQRPKIETVLMVDDDIEFTLDQAQELVNYTRKHAHAASAMYSTTDRRLAGVPYETPVGDKQLWLMGLGFIAFPAWQLLKLEGLSEEFDQIDGKYRAFTSSGVRNGKWRSEDLTLCERLGGVHLLPMAVGHLKTVAIYPSEESIGHIREGRLLPTRPKKDGEK